MFVESSDVDLVCVVVRVLHVTSLFPFFCCNAGSDHHPCLYEISDDNTMLQVGVHDTTIGSDETVCSSGPGL